MIWYASFTKREPYPSCPRNPYKQSKTFLFNPNRYEKGKVQNTKGEIVEVEVISVEESRILLKQSSQKERITLQDALAQGHIPLEDFDRELRNSAPCRTDTLILKEN